MATYKLKSDVLAQKVVDEMVILEPENGEYFTVNGVGSDMIALLEEGKSEDEVVAAMTEKFDVDADEVRADYRTLLEQLDEQGLVEVVA
ncbi:PqqD family protein [Aestuariibacter sp. A3R04]|uniref:PqqD family protein n=1 Tax=Aestuariibacter sp. A3R04 TaxID=2841571 RepID=UPI001C0964A5|nr:PqqD family protein [Aestuariibacter sp. A3R04]MBU3020906.1 PqqD family protein [Aestuariibacter sp. A3R04]